MSPERSQPSEGPRPDIFLRLEQAVGEIHDSESFRRYLDVQARFHQYSFGNAILILSQRPDASRVAGFRAWQRMNRFVKKGEKAIKIIVPLSKKVVDPTTGDESREIFFSVGNVFSLEQTDG